MTYVRSNEDEADAVERVIARVENYPFEIDLLNTDCDFYNERAIPVLVTSLQRWSMFPRRASG